MTEEERAIEDKCCWICKHCFYTGLPGAYGCDVGESPFVDLYDTCDKWELDGEFTEGSE